MPQRYGNEPKNKQNFTRRYDAFYTRFAPIYDLFVKWFPIWKNWLKHALPCLRGQRVLEISFGTGYLLTQYAHRFDTYGIDYNHKMALVASSNLKQARLVAHLQIANVEAIPYPDESFDCLVNTMAFSGYPDARAAMSEMYRVLRSDGILVLIDINYPLNKNWLGMALCHGWVASGDILRDMAPLFHQVGFNYTDREIGGFGSVHLYEARKRDVSQKGLNMSAKL